MILEAKEIFKIYKGVNKELTVLDNINFQVTKGEILSIVGPSGSGKTTLLGLCAGLDNPSSGTIKLAGEPISQLTENEKAEIRNRKVGFIFQNFQLLPTLTALENVMIPMELQGRSIGARAKAIELLKRVGLGGRHDHYPSQLSGGEKQRVSLARAFSNDPEILFADEPTGNLDKSNAKNIFSLLTDLADYNNSSLIVATHDLEMASLLNEKLTIENGLLKSI